MSTIEKGDLKFLDYYTSPPRSFFLKLREAIDKVDKRAIKTKIDESFIENAESGSEAKSIKELRMQRYINLSQLCLNGRGFRYSGAQSLKAYETYDKAVVPITGRIWTGNPLHDELTYAAGTCGTTCWFFLAWWLNSIGKQTFRTGRNGNWIVTFPWSGKRIGGSLHRGYAEYATPLLDGKWQKGSSLGEKLWEIKDQLNNINVLEFSSHVIIIAKFNENFSILNPNTDQPVKTGKDGEGHLYRFGADGGYKREGGAKKYNGQKNTFRILDHNEASHMRWRVFTIDNIDDDGMIHHGPLADNKSVPIVLEGMEDIVDRIPTLEDAKKAGLT